MCGAFGVITPDNIIDRFQVDPFDRWGASYNIRPTQHAPIITRHSPNTVHLAIFGFIPSWSKETKPKLMPINARAETVAVSGLFKSSFAKSRCIVPANFWYEWHKTELDGKPLKTPYAFKVSDQEMFGFAGIYSEREDAEGRKIYTFAIITTKPNEAVAKFHNRMPAVLHKNDEDSWLDKTTDIKRLLRMIKPYESSKIMSWRVSSRVNSPQNDSPDLIKEVK